MVTGSIAAVGAHCGGSSVAATRVQVSSKPLPPPPGLDGDARSGSRAAAPTPPPTQPPTGPDARYVETTLPSADPWPRAALFTARFADSLPAHRCLSFAIAVCNETLSGSGDSGYRGCQTRTRSGAVCQWWDSNSYNPTMTHAYHPTSGLTVNYCRNPDGEDTIWCYTVNGSRYELCDPLPGVFLPRHRLGHRPR